MINIPFLGENIIKIFKSYPSDDFIDLLNYKITPILFIFFAILISTKQYIGSPVECLMPAEFNNGWKQYTENFCFTQNTYFVSLNNQIPKKEERKYLEIHFYHWLPFLVFIGAISFYLPAFLRKLNNNAINLEQMLNDFKNLKNKTKEIRMNEMKRIADYIKEYLEINRNKHLLFPLLFLNFTSIFSISTIYIFKKFIILLNIIFQFTILTLFVGKKDPYWGWKLLNTTINDKIKVENIYFPYITFCDISFKRIGDLHNYSIQCLLQINIINEKIFLFIWYWLIFLFVLSLINFLFILIKFFSPLRILQMKYLSKNMKLNKKFLQMFDKEFFFIILLINNNYDVFLMELLTEINLSYHIANF
jgi:hypothetical protein